MIHYTLNTGHTRVSPRSEVSDDVIAMLQPMFAGLPELGEHLIPNTDLWVSPTVGSPRRGLMLAPIYRKTGGIHHNVAWVGVCDKPSDTDAWDCIERLYLGLTDEGQLAAADLAPPRKPASTPWCAVILDTHSAKNIEQMDWLGDFERCLAWAYLDSRK